MPPKSKSKATKSKEVAIASSKKQSMKATKQAQARAEPQQDWIDTEDEVTSDEALSAPFIRHGASYGQYDGNDLRTFSKRSWPGYISS